MKLQLVILIILIFFVIYISYKNYEKFTDVDEQRDVDISSKCLVQSSYFYADLSNFAKKLHETFRDNSNYNYYVKSLAGKFGELINSMLLSDQSYKNMYDLNEYETNLRMFKTTIFYTFKNLEMFPNVGYFHKLGSADPSITNNMEKLKHILYYGDKGQFQGLIKIFVDYVEFFTSKDMDHLISNLRTQNIIDGGLYDKYNKHFKLQHIYKDLDGDIKKIYRDNIHSSIRDNDRIDVARLNDYIKTQLELSPDYDITKCFGYYHLRNFIEHLKYLKDSKYRGDSSKRKLAERLLDYYDKGSNNRKKILYEISKKYFDTGDVFGIWDDKRGKYGFGKYGVMNRIYRNIGSQYVDAKIKLINDKEPYNRIFKLLEEYRPIYLSSEQNIEDLVLTPNCY